MPELLSRIERVEHVRNFKTEVRGLLDVKHLINRASVLRNISNYTEIHTILLKMFNELQSNNHNETFDMALFKNAVFSISDNENLAPRLHHKIQCYSGTDFFDVNQTWLVTYAAIDGLKQSHLAIATLSEPTNLGLEMEETQIIVLVLSPSFDKHTKSAPEIARTFATLLMNDDVRQRVCNAEEDNEIRSSLQEYAQQLSQTLSIPIGETFKDKLKNQELWPYYPGRGIIRDFQRRWPHYKSDFLDGLSDYRSMSKVASTAAFLLFTILPTSIAYGMLNDDNTEGEVSVQKVILGQWIGGLLFAIFGGQELLIVTTSAPLSIYISVIYDISKNNDINFWNMYTAVGIYAMVILILFAVFQLSALMSFSTRSTEEIFSMFIALTLFIKAIIAIVNSYSKSYGGCYSNEMDKCDPSQVLLFVFLLFGTFWLSMTIMSFRSTPYLSRRKRDILSDYALPISVLLFALISILLFNHVKKEEFPIYSRYKDVMFSEFYNLPGYAHGSAIGLAIPLAILFFMDQLLVTATVDNNDNKLKKGSAHNWDLMIVAILNIFLSLFCLPWMHGALPSSFLHLRALSDVEDRLHNGYIQTVIVNVRETRLATIIAHVIMIPIYFFLVPFITVFVPTSILNGIFMFMAFSSLAGNEFWERVLLLFTEQRAYPPTHYIRKVPQRIIHQFTCIEIIQLLILLIISFSQTAYVEMVFPIIIGLSVPFRYFILPLFIRKEYLEAIDGKH